MNANNAEIIGKLREAGYQVHLQHQRYFDRSVSVVSAYNQRYDAKQTTKSTYPLKALETFNKDLHPDDTFWNLSANGGATILKLVDKEGAEFDFEAKCNLGDPFRRKLGTSIALNRAAKVLLA